MKRVLSGPRGTVVAVVVFLACLGFGPPTVAAVPSISLSPPNNSTVRPGEPFRFEIRITFDAAGQFRTDSITISVNGTDYSRDLVAAIVAGDVVTSTSANVTTLAVPQISLGQGQYQVTVRVVSSTGTGTVQWSITVQDTRLSAEQRALIAERGNPDYFLITFNTSPFRVEETWKYLSLNREYVFWDGTRSDEGPLPATQGSTTPPRPPRLDPSPFTRGLTLDQLTQMFGPRSASDQIPIGPVPTTYAWSNVGFLASFRNGVLHDVKSVDVR